jgi:DNA-binding transcriptional LysR family regulator
LGLTPSGVSRAVARLEARVGVRLFDRTPRAVTLTDEGRQFHASIAPLLAEIEDAATAAAGSATTVRGRLRVNVDPWFARQVLAPHLPAFMAAYPELSLDVMVHDRLGDMVGDGIDVALRFDEPEPSALIARKLLETNIVTYAAPSYLARHGEPRRPHDLERHECLQSRNSLTGKPFSWEFHRGGKIVKVEAKGRLVFNDVAAKLEACIAGHGIAQTFALGLEPMLKSGALVQLLPDWAEERFPLYVYYVSRHLPPAKVRAFIRFVESAVTPIPINIPSRL